MSRLSIETPGRAQNVLDGLHQDMERRISASAHGLCPVDISLRSEERRVGKECRL